MNHVGGAKKREKTADELADELSRMFNVATRINKRQSDRAKKVPEFFKPAVAKSPKKRTVGVSLPKKVKIAKGTAKGTAKASVSNALAIVPAAAAADVPALPEGFTALMQYDPKLTQFRARIHRRDQTAFAPAEAYQVSKVEAAQTILTQELANLQSLRELILKKRDEIAQAAAAPETSGAAEARAMEAARLAAIEEEYGPAPSEEMLSDYSMGSPGSRKSSRSSPNARAAAASGPLMLMPPPARGDGAAPMEGGRRKKK